MSLTKKINQERLTLLNQGVIETSNLMEALAISFPELLSNTIPKFIPPELPENTKILRLMQEYGKSMLAQLDMGNVLQYTKHPSDTIRGITCYAIAVCKLDTLAKFNLLKPLADDSHFSVREWAWIAIRPEFNEHTILVIDFLSDWVTDTSANIRRYASELTRPRGVWCAHNKLLKTNPELAITILDPLKSDPAKYVQLSVGNWLNDAGKDNPTWVINLTDKWLAESKTKETEKIVKRGRRNL